MTTCRGTHQLEGRSGHRGLLEQRGEGQRIVFADRFGLPKVNFFFTDFVNERLATPIAPLVDFDGKSFKSIPLISTFSAALQARVKVE